MREKVKSYINKKNSNIQQLMMDILLRLLGLVDRKGLRIMGGITRAYSNHFSNYALSRILPKFTETKREDEILHLNSQSDVAIVLQGLVLVKDDFTLNSVRLYKELYPNVKIIVSTWDYTDSEVVKQLELEGCEIILNKSFTPSGFGNVNYQICTSLAGIKRAKEIGAKYVIKSRTDQRIYKKTALSYLKSILATYQVDDETHKIGQHGRIVALAGSMLLPLYFTDFFFFGYTEDMEALFDIPYEPRNIPGSQKFYGEKYGGVFTADKFYIDIPAEVYIISQYLKKYMDIEYTVKFYWEIIKRYFITIDYEDIGLMWPKYGFNLPQWTDTHNTFCSFISLLNGEIEYKSEYEDYRKSMTIDVRNFL